MSLKRPYNISIIQISRKLLIFVENKLMRIVKLIFFFFGWSTALLAQPYLVRDQSIEVTNGSIELKLAWVGGLNNPQFSNIDFNQDNKNDLFVFDKSGNLILPLIQHGSNSEIDYSFNPEYIENFPKLNDWALLRDYNCDGFMDIFSYSGFGPGAMVYENNGQIGTNWFSIADSIVYTHYEIGGSSGDVNIFISTIDVPAIHDIDNDGDLDIFTYQLQGSKVEFHKNFSQENQGECGLEFELKNRCWGYFSEDDDSEEILLGQDCFNVLNPEISGTAHHSGSTLLMMDINNDGFKDLVMGDVSYSSLTTVVNGGPNISGLDSVTSVNYFFPNTSEELILHTFPASFYVDVNNDDINDFIAAPNAQFTSDNVDAVSLYLNNGGNDNPDLEFEQNDFLQGEMIDVGEGAYPVFVDVNQDGLMDILIGNRKKIIDSLTTSSLHYFKNTGSTNNPSFNLEDDDAFNLTSTGVGEALYPTFIDLDGDNSMDLVIGNLQGELFYLINSANENEEMVFPGPAFPLNDNNDEAIDVGQLAKPFVFDMNEDDLLDLVIGERSGRLTYYENTGTSSTPDFTWISDTLGGVQSPGFLLNTGYSSPFFYTEDDEIKLIIGSETGEILYYEGISGNLSGTFELSNGPASNLYEGKRIALARYDLNNDGYQDLIIGNYRGGLSFFKGDLSSNINELTKKEGFNLFPNPASDVINISFEDEMQHSVSIFNALGQVVLEVESINEKEIQISTSQFKDGQYIIRVDNTVNLYIKTFVVLH